MSSPTALPRDSGDAEALVRSLGRADLRAFSNEYAALLARLDDLAGEALQRYSESRASVRTMSSDAAEHLEDFAARVRRAHSVFREALVEGWSRACDELGPMADGSTFSPGEIAPASGQYEILDAEGRGTGEERTVVKGKHLPPTPRPEQEYRLVDRTENAAGRR